SLALPVPCPLFPVSWLAVGADGRPLAVALFADREERGVGISHDHTDAGVSAAELDAADSLSVATAGPHRRLAEADRLPAGRRHDDLVSAIGHCRGYQLVPFLEVDGNDADLFRPAVLLQRRLFHQAAFGGHDEECAAL